MRLSRFAVLAGLTAVAMTLLGTAGTIEDPTYGPPLGAAAALLLALGLITGIEAFLGASMVAVALGFGLGGTHDFGTAAAAGVAMLVVVGATRVCWEARRPARVSLGAQRSLVGSYLALAGIALGAAVSFRVWTDVSPPRVFIALGVLVAAAPLFALRYGLRPAARLSHAARFGVAIGLAIVLSALVGLGAIASEQSGADPAADTESAPAEQDDVQTAPAELGATDDEEEEAPLRDRLLGLAGIFLVLMVMILLTTNLFRDQPLEFKPTDATPGDGEMAMFDHREGDPVSQLVTPDAAATVVDDALSAIADVADPRRAVRLAYATLERGFGDLQATRGATESEAEYLERLLPRLGVAAASLRRLTALFERARFSPHHIDESMRADAVAALQTLQAELTPTSDIEAGAR